MNEKKLSLLNEDLDEESQKYLQESISAWKEEMFAKLQEEVEQAKNAKIEELEEANIAYREELKEEYSDKLFAALNDLRESVQAEATSNVIKNNPELKILEQIKGLVAPLLNENYVEETYSNTITKLSEENEVLKHEKQLQEGAETLYELIKPYSEKTRKLVLSLIKEGTSEEITEQFYNIMESLQEVFGEGDEGTDGGDDGGEGDDGEGEDKKKKKKDSDDEDEDDEDGGDDGDDGNVGEGYLPNDGILNEDDDDAKANTMAQIMKKLSKV